MVVRGNGIQDNGHLDDSERALKKAIVFRNLSDSIRLDREFSQKIMVHISNLGPEMFVTSCLSGGARSILDSG
jgi:hypothetical protein